MSFDSLNTACAVIAAGLRFTPVGAGQEARLRLERVGALSRWTLSAVDAQVKFPTPEGAAVERNANFAPAGPLLDALRSLGPLSAQPEIGALITAELAISQDGTWRWHEDRMQAPSLLKPALMDLVAELLLYWRLDTAVPAWMEPGAERVRGICPALEGSGEWPSPLPAAAPSGIVGALGGELPNPDAGAFTQLIEAGGLDDVLAVEAEFCGAAFLVPWTVFPTAPKAADSGGALLSSKPQDGVLVGLPGEVDPSTMVFSSGEQVRAYEKASAVSLGNGAVQWSLVLGGELRSGMVPGAEGAAWAVVDPAGAAIDVQLPWDRGAPVWGALRAARRAGKGACLEAVRAGGSFLIPLFQDQAFSLVDAQGRTFIPAFSSESALRRFVPDADVRGLEAEPMVRNLGPSNWVWIDPDVGGPQVLLGAADIGHHASREPADTHERPSAISPESPEANGRPPKRGTWIGWGAAAVVALAVGLGAQQFLGDKGVPEARVMEYLNAVASGDVQAQRSMTQVDSLQLPLFKDEIYFDAGLNSELRERPSAIDVTKIEKSGSQRTGRRNFSSTDSLVTVEYQLAGDKRTAQFSFAKNSAGTWLVSAPLEGTITVTGSDALPGLNSPFVLNGNTQISALDAVSGVIVPPGVYSVQVGTKDSGPLSAARDVTLPAGVDLVLDRE